MTRFAPIVFLWSAAVGCGLVAGGKGPTAASDAPAAHADVVASLKCIDEVSGRNWAAKVAADRVERCTFHGRDGTLELLVGDAFELRIMDFTGTGSYLTSPGKKNTRVSVFAQGGPEGAATTRADSEMDACKVICNVEVASSTVNTVEPGAKGTVSVEVKCPILARPSGEGCVTCQITPPEFAKISTPSCDRVD